MTPWVYTSEVSKTTDNNEATITAFFENYPIVRLGKGQALLRPDDEVTKIHYLLEGRVVEYDISSTGNTVIINTFKPGAFFPMSSVLNHQKCEYFFEADSPVAARVAPASHVVKFLEDNPLVTLDLLRRVYRGTDGILRRMAHLMGGTARSRLIYELINAAHRYGEDHPDGAVFIPLSESDLAKRSGLSRETVSRTIRELKSSGIVRVDRTGVEIPNVSALKRIIGNDL